MSSVANMTFTRPADGMVPWRSPYRMEDSEASGSVTLIDSATQKGKLQNATVSLRQ